jgi:DNA repair exonuclease SbcCD nuclease subunit
MKKKYLILCDTHLGVHKSSDIWHQTTIKLFETIVDECNRRNIDTIIHLGDWFDDRKSLNIKTMSVSTQIATMLREFDVFIITGNHDTYYKTLLYPSSLDVFRKYHNFTIVDSVINTDDFIMAPWDCLTEEILEKGGKNLLGHFEINTFSATNTFTYTKSLYNPSDFSNFELVLSGHFHIPSKKENIVYLGAPFHMTFNDTGSNRGYYIFDDGELEFIPFTEYPKFIVIDTEKPVISEQITGNIVKIKFQKDYGTNKNNKIIEDIQALHPLQLHTDFSGISMVEKNVVSTIDESESIKLKDHRNIFHDYIDKVNPPEKIKKATLKKIIDNMLTDE